ncbi:putative f-box domain protein [Neofusicoccum parvum UCRNP2]|uniref:Putative f-box domain protein n=1 Tax=Botryosphaeria parva (strain UCR-NP2) TaxID=1287680 RepID=R1GC42_BOTPV|nr:putative f-box domain protein [Neofusicoccum parvum UCRNP2]
MAQVDSIDAVVSTAGDATPANLAHPASDAIPIDRPKLKGRQRLLSGLQRIGSSPSLAKMGRTSSGYRGGKASMSCVSLSSAGSPYSHSYGSSWSSELSNGYSTAPTSASSTPAPEAQHFDKARIRLVDGQNTSASVPLPADLRPGSRLGTPGVLPGVDEDYFSRPVQQIKKLQRRPNFSFWGDMPQELRIEILSYLKPKEIVRSSSVSKHWYKMCFDGQLWGRLDVSGFYRDIPADALVNIITSAGPFVEHLNISWCNNIDTRGIRKVIEGCPNLKDLRAGEVRGWDDVDFMSELFKRNTLERLILMNCDSVNDDSLAALVEGVDSEIDVLTGRAIVPPRKLKHLDLTRCRGLTDIGIKKLAYNLPELEGLQLSKCSTLTDNALQTILPTFPSLTHLDLEELDELTNATLQTLAAAPCNAHLSHLSISYCELLGDAGMLPVLKSCNKLQTLDMDNTRVSDLVLTEAAAMMRARNRAYAKC